MQGSGVAFLIPPGYAYHDGCHQSQLGLNPRGKDQPGMYRWAVGSITGNRLLSALIVPLMWLV